MDLLIVTGLSGSGKSISIKTLEDIGFNCIDNVPVNFMFELAKKQKNKTAFVCDIRDLENIKNINSEINKLKQNKISVKVLFLDANDNVLVGRYKETRRKHCLINAQNTSLINAVKQEREYLSNAKKIYDYFIDTSFLSSNQLKQKIRDLFSNNLDYTIINFLSFGFKYGCVPEADLVFDVRCLPNPYYVPELKNITGLDSKVNDYVLSHKVSQEFLNKLKKMLDFLIPLYLKEGKSQLVIAIGCTGGKHRSVTFVQKLNQYFSSNNSNVIVTHRDINKN